jgi:hypothetical protein
MTAVRRCARHGCRRAAAGFLGVEYEFGPGVRGLVITALEVCQEHTSLEPIGDIRTRQGIYVLLALNAGLDGSAIPQMSAEDMKPTLVPATMVPEKALQAWRGKRWGTRWL